VKGGEQWQRGSGQRWQGGYNERQRGVGGGIRSIVTSRWADIDVIIEVCDEFC
jgi:hypothetical protein